MAHLHGREWVHGAYQHYAARYLEVEQAARSRSFESYKQLAQKGITALDALQSREVPFHIRVADGAQSFRVQRDVPERLKFTADMSQVEREEATRGWKLAREHIHQDYEAVKRLDFALTELLDQVTRVRLASDEGLIEQYRICRQLGELDEGGELPFELPYQVTRDDYRRVLYLLVDRLEGDRARLAGLEASIVAVGLTARSTDAGSATLAASVKKVLLAVLSDAAEVDAPAAAYPQQEEARAAALSRGRDLVKKISASEEYQSWLAAQREAEDSLGQLLVVLDSLTGLPTSSIYKTVLQMWRGDADYLDYLELAASFVPGGGQLSRALGEGVGYSRELRKHYSAAVAQAGGARELAAAVTEGDGGLTSGRVLNLASSYARQRLGKQLVFFQTPEELAQVEEELAASEVSRGVLEAVPAPQR